MKIHKEPKWELLISRFFVASGIPGFTWNSPSKRFEGVKGFAFVRVTPRMEEGWKNLPSFFKRYEGTRNQGNPHPVVLLCTSKENGPNIEDTFVMMRLETYSKMLVSLVNNDPARYIGRN